tara:strand:+ start:15358 stop:15828 length:471 start_codon:yes stop_codon:yes gene_type:complete
MDIFNPTLCLAKELKNSWCQNIVTELDQSKVPIEVVEGVPRLKMVHDERSPHSWFAVALPTQSSWEPCDISEFSSLSFTIYMEEGSGGIVRIEDSSGNESEDMLLSDIVKEFNDESSVEIDLNPLKESALDMENIKLIKFIGYKGAAFYISEVCLQ